MHKARFYPSLSMWLSRPKALRFWAGVFTVVAAGLSLSPAASAQDVYYACIGDAGSTGTNPLAGCPAGTMQTQFGSVSIGGDNPVQIVAGVLKQGATPHFQSLAFTKAQHDAVSDSLAKDAYQGTVVPALVLGIYSVGATTPSYVLALRGVEFESYSVSGTSGNSPPQETLSAGYQTASFLNYPTNQTVKWTNGQ